MESAIRENPPRWWRPCGSPAARGATTICITSYGDSAITHCSDVKFFTTSETLLNGGDNSLARIAQTSIINLLYLNVALKYNRYHNTDEGETI